MIPSILAAHVERGVKDFIRTTFPVTTPFFSGIFERFLQDDKLLFKGPWLDIGLPFRSGSSGRDFFPSFTMKFPPYLHQEKAFQRLRGENPQPTLVATGTGSGKTESFLYPILDYCARHKGEQGIKAILIYPMNALASDQATRLASMIHNSELKGNVTAGIYVGQEEKEPAPMMKADRLISDKEILRTSPPDILLTNYKMLDYLLLRPDDKTLWNYNTPETLRFLVVDELHTFDGAQGADLGCLIRRLKARVMTPEGWLCPVGTSATMGGAGEEGREGLLEFATAIFGEPFTEESVVTEERVSAADFLGDSLISDRAVPPPQELHRLDPAGYNDKESWLAAQMELWFGSMAPQLDAPGWQLELGEQLRQLRFFHNLLKLLGGKIVSCDDILQQLTRVTSAMQDAEEPKGRTEHYRNCLLISLLALISEARIGSVESMRPFLNTRLQLWMREMRRMLASVEEMPQIHFVDDLNEEQLQRHLPVVHCRECGGMGWAGLRKQNAAEVRGNLKEFYPCFFQRPRSPQVVYLFPRTAEEQEMQTGGYWFCPSCLQLTTKETDTCPSCDHKGLLLVYLPDTRVESGSKMTSSGDCPLCGAKNGLSLVGSRAASLISVMIAQLYSSTYNDDKKLLTFSDNVQDAAHRAGFFNSRTYTFNFRIALQQVVQSGEGSSRLSELPQRFVEQWRQRVDSNTFLATFLAPNMEWLQEYEQLRRDKKLAEGSELFSLVEQRIGWEIFSEYGFRARVGRTLEKSGASVAAVDFSLVERCLPALGETIRNELGALRQLEEAQLALFVRGLLVHLKNQGAIMLPVLKGYVAELGNSYLLNRMRWMPGFGRQSRTPVFLMMGGGSAGRYNRFDRVMTRGRSWYVGWMEKCFHGLLMEAETMQAANDPERFYSFLLNGLVDAGVLTVLEAKQRQPVWGIAPEALQVSAQVVQLRCDCCDHALSVAAAEADAWQGSPCHRMQCGGSYRAVEERAENYYQTLYQRGDVQRIFAREHTGLLKREEREELEKEFKATADRWPWAPNLLSCTPTLEMGIDIGDLSTLVMCSVPPSQAAYLQRLGRAGRQDGNALGLTVATARPHDLYFFAEPENMLGGEVEVPGVFLDASAVLERQFTAFCFDRWISMEERVVVPAELGKVLGALEPVDDKKFPHNFLRFIELHQSDFLRDFIEMFSRDGSLSAESAAALKLFVEGRDTEVWFLRGRIMNGLHARNNELVSLRKKVRALTARIKKEKAAPQDKNSVQLMQELKIEKGALQALVKNIRERNTWNFFTDEGLLPNYAFPEVGVILNSLIHRKKSTVAQGESSYDTWSYEYERPAGSAIAELAPANTFYAEGRKVVIDQVDMGVSEVETWRFCPDCSHRELEGVGEQHSFCPRCGNTLWADAGQKREMLRMRQVFATTSDRQSRISDDADDRQPVFYNRQTLVEFDESLVQDAWKVDGDFPFGFDFLEKVDFCEINFGEHTDHVGESVIAGVRRKRKGFQLCRVCGKVQQEGGEIAHSFTCTAKDKEDTSTLMDCLYLYRQFTSEAIRILLPVNVISESERRLQSFIAAVQLGLKKRFRGRIDHLQTTVHEEPIPGTTLRKKFLVLYDTVPGGTGYLKQLMQSEKEMMEVLSLALATLRSCACNQEEGKDGCYRCLYAYRNSYTMKQTSRDTAVELLAEILSWKDALVRTKNVNEVSINTFIESELEARFLGALKAAKSTGLPVSLKNDLVNGKPGWFLRVATESYYLEPQVEVGELDGVAVPSRVDFVLRPTRLASGIKPIAIFLDGFSWHRERVGRDTAQRMALLWSGRYHVWSLTWQDVENVFEPQGDFFRDLLSPGGLPQGGNWERLLAGYQVAGKKPVGMNSFDMLLHWLADPQRPGVESWTRFAFVHALCCIDPQCNPAQWAQVAQRCLPGEQYDELVTAAQSLHGVMENGEGLVTRCVQVEQAAVAPPGDAAGVLVCCHLDDSESSRERALFQSEWTGFLRALNFYQFLPKIFWSTSEGLAAEEYDSLIFPEVAVEAEMEMGVPDGPAVDEGWGEVKSYLDEGYHPFVELLIEAGCPAPVSGYELSGAGDEIIATAEMAFEAAQVALLLPEEAEYKEKFKDAGWQVFLLDEVAGEEERASEISTLLL